MKFRPLHDRVVLKRIEAEEKTSGGIIIPDTAKEKPQEGEVVAVGPGGRDEAAHSHRLEGRRSRALRQMVRYRGQDRWRRLSGHEGERRHGRAHRDRRSPKGGLTPRKFDSSLLWSRVTSRSRRGRYVDSCRNPIRKGSNNGCQTSSIFGRRARQDAARR